MQSLLWPEVPALFISNFGVAALWGIEALAKCVQDMHPISNKHMGKSCFEDRSSVAERYDSCTQAVSVSCGCSHPLGATR